MLTDLVLGDGKLSLSIDGGSASFDYFWLRDNARDPVSFDSRSHQRELFTASVDPDIRPHAAHVSEAGDSLVLTWPDLEGEARYEAAFLADFADAADPLRMPAPQPWDAAALDPDAVRLSYADFTTDGGVALLLQRVLAYGFAVLTDTPRHACGSLPDWRHAQPCRDTSVPRCRPRLAETCFFGRIAPGNAGGGRHPLDTDTSGGGEYGRLLAPWRRCPCGRCGAQHAAASGTGRRSGASGCRQPRTLA